MAESSALYEIRRSGRVLFIVETRYEVPIGVYKVNAYVRRTFGGIPIRMTDVVMRVAPNAKDVEFLELFLAQADGARIFRSSPLTTYNLLQVRFELPPELLL